MIKSRVLLCFAFAGTAVYAQNTITTTAVQRYFNPVRSNIEAAADQMPADKYSYRLTPGQMTFAEWVIHSAGRNFQDCAVLKGETPPNTEAKLKPLKEKNEVVKALKDSFNYCEGILQTVTDQKLESSPDIAYSFLHTIVHNNEIYGNMVGYLRTSDIVPPSTVRMQEMMRNMKNKK
jgi:hypothetical protein